ncbi:MAG: hypothetical protein ICV60_23700, partial [Pyrinomonadaceae bacterium]|nr:hypothetical protein [Pyrinomonadaceae bacterium]
MMRINGNLKALALAIVLTIMTPLAGLAQQGAEQAPSQGEKEKSSGVMSKIFGGGSKEKQEKEAPKKSTQTATPQTAAQGSQAAA